MIGVIVVVSVSWPFSKFIVIIFVKIRELDLVFFLNHPLDAFRRCSKLLTIQEIV
jgi:hypothetical protein